MSEIDQQFIEYVVKSLVGNPDAVSIKRTIDEKGVLLELTVDPEDLGRVIGKRGATAQSLRTLLRALGTKNDARYNLKIIDNSPEGEPAASKPKADKPGRSEEDSSAGSEEPAAEAEETSVPEPKTKEPEPEKPAEPEESSSDETSERLAKARRELADLDDLDV
jgi:predicted RNA-binding protein YlqC (UPF0109 family)